MPFKIKKTLYSAYNTSYRRIQEKSRKSSRLDFPPLCNHECLPGIFFVQTINYDFLHAHNCCVNITKRCINGSNAKSNSIWWAEIWQDVHLVNQCLIDAQTLGMAKRNMGSPSVCFTWIIQGETQMF